jgi:hypothetical protein
MEFKFVELEDLSTWRTQLEEMSTEFDVTFLVLLLRGRVNHI